MASAGRFVAGTVLASRYPHRDSGWSGRRGQVYRAEDLTLGQLVALKFLPEALSLNPSALTRFVYSAESTDYSSTSDWYTLKIVDLNTGRTTFSTAGFDGYWSPDGRKMTLLEALGRRISQQTHAAPDTC